MQPMFKQILQEFKITMIQLVYNLEIGEDETYDLYIKPVTKNSTFNSTLCTRPIQSS